jgi:hypothetical protein
MPLHDPGRVSLTASHGAIRLGRRRRTAREASARSPSKKRRPEAIHHRREHQTPPSRLAETRETLLAPRQFHDLFPDIRRQMVPARDKLAQSQISARQAQIGVRGVGPIALLDNDWSISGRGCNSRRLHSLCCKPCDFNGVGLLGTRVVPTGCVSEHLSRPRLDALANCLSTSLWVSEFPQYRCLFLFD